MHSTLSISISIFTVCFISLFFLPISYSQDDENSVQCLITPFKCGHIENLTFPFWKDDRPQFCRHDEDFKLTKCEEPLPVIEIGGHQFRLIYLNHSTYTMTLARNDLWDQICLPNPINVTLAESSFLSYPQTNRDLTFFYNCNSSIPYTNSSGRGNYESFRDKCDTAIQVQVNQTAFAQVLQMQKEREQFVGGWRLGFDVVYNFGAIFCQKCNSLPGKCANLSSPIYPLCKDPGLVWCRR